MIFGKQLIDLVIALVREQIEKKHNVKVSNIKKEISVFYKRAAESENENEKTSLRSKAKELEKEIEIITKYSGEYRQILDEVQVNAIERNKEIAKQLKPKDIFIIDSKNSDKLLLNGDAKIISADPPENSKG